MKVTAVKSEFKRYMTHGEFVPMLSRLKEYTSTPPFTDERGKYHVRTVYFGRRRVRASRTRKLHGERTDQFFIRYYHNDLRTLRLCKASTFEKRVMTAYTPITEAQCRAILDRDYTWLSKSDDELVQEFYQKLVVDEYVTKNVVDNDKVALESHIGGVQICVDINIRTTNRAEQFLEPEISAMPLDGARTLVLKVKYDRQLQEPLRSIVGYGLAR